MEFQEYMKIKRRMVKLSQFTGCEISCYDCPLGSKGSADGGIECEDFEMLYPEKAEDIVKQWAKEHPQKTYMKDFLEKFPKAKIGEDNIPTACREYIYGGGCPEPANCLACWNEPMEEQVHD